MSLMRLILCMLSCGELINATAAYSQTYPAKPIRIVTVEPGGSSDFIARLLAQGLTQSMGQQAIVDDRAGASGVIAIEIVAKSPPDGYTLLSYSSTLWNLALLQNVPYDPVKDFIPITLAARSPNILVVPSSLAATSVKELIALAKAHPGELNYGSGGTGSATHIAGELFKFMAGIDMVRIAYKGGASALNAILGGQIQVFFATAASVAPHVKSGRLKALAVTSATPSALAPDLPTVAAAGVPGYESGAIYCVFAPAKTSAAIISRLNLEIVQSFKKPEMRDRFLNAGVEPVGSSVEQISNIMKSDMEKMKKLFKDTNIRVE